MYGYLHYDIKCQIEKSIDDQDSQQVGSKVIRCSNNTIDGTASGKKNSLKELVFLVFSNCCLQNALVFLIGPKTRTILSTNQIQNENQSSLRYSRFPALQTVSSFFGLSSHWFPVIFPFL